MIVNANEIMTKEESDKFIECMVFDSGYKIKECDQFYFPTIGLGIIYKDGVFEKVKHDLEIS